MLAYRNEPQPVELDGIRLKQNDRSIQIKLEGFVNPVWLPLSQITFHEDGVASEGQYKGKTTGRIEIPRWLARKEGLLG